ncbi:MAG: helix-turn-helix domain-containing protein [Oscillospiraceae bacterium]|nr:helix-turn-helix domain-containing protein [Oscillospiraceae bacterium]
MRTIDEAAAFLRQADPNTAVTKTALRRLVTSGQIPSVRVGAKYLVDLGVLDEFFAGGVRETVSQNGTIRRLEVL